MSDIPINLTSDLSPDERYLWDTTGTPTQSTLAIETALSQLRYSGKSLPLRSLHLTLSGRWPALAIAAILFLTIAVPLYLVLRMPATIYSGWTIASSTGTPSITRLQSKTPGGEAVRITTDANSSALLNLKKTIQLHLSPSSDATLTGAPSIELASGQALIEVPPNFEPAPVITTPAVTCTLAPGCSASIESTNGTTQVRVQSGWAEVSSGNESLRLSDSMACSTQPKSTTIWPPYRISKDTNSNALTKQIDNILYGKNDETSQFMLLQQALQGAKPQDAALLWNLLPRLNEPQRRPVRDRLAKLIKNPPKGPAFDAVLTLDKEALDAWWNAIVGH